MYIYICRYIFVYIYIYIYIYIDYAEALSIAGNEVSMWDGSYVVKPLKSQVPFSGCSFSKECLCGTSLHLKGCNVANPTVAISKPQPSD